MKQIFIYSNCMAIVRCISRGMDVTVNWHRDSKNLCLFKRRLTLLYATISTQKYLVQVKFSHGDFMQLILTWQLAYFYFRRFYTENTMNARIFFHLQYFPSLTSFIENYSFTFHWYFIKKKQEQNSYNKTVCFEVFATLIKIGAFLKYLLENYEYCLVYK